LREPQAPSVSAAWRPRSRCCPGPGADRDALRRAVEQEPLLSSRRVARVGWRACWTGSARATRWRWRRPRRFRRWPDRVRPVGSIQCIGSCGS